LKLGSRSFPNIELPAGIASDDGPFSSFFGYRKSRTEKVADSSLRRPVSQAGLAERAGTIETGPESIPDNPTNQAGQFGLAKAGSRKPSG